MDMLLDCDWLSSTQSIPNSRPKNTYVCFRIVFRTILLLLYGRRLYDKHSTLPCNLISLMRMWGERGEGCYTENSHDFTLT